MNERSYKLEVYGALEAKINCLISLYDLEKKEYKKGWEIEIVEVSKMLVPILYDLVSRLDTLETRIKKLENKNHA